ncbi:MAG: beta-ribofuranosylaminobenzene 5'-phosphate synthase family protein [bacterium]
MKVSVTTGSRLHIGFTNLSKDAGRYCGSIGVALDYPCTSVVMAKRVDLVVAGDHPEQTVAWIRRFSEHFDVEPRAHVDVRESIPQHVGLGSGTQLALAVGVGLATLHGVKASVQDVALAMTRGKRSGIGIAAFQTGGFIIDAGHKLGGSGVHAPASVVWRQDFPPDWCFVVAIPGSGKGLNGPGEEGVFAALSASVRVSEEICRLTHLKLMPALVEKDIEEFGCALTDIDRKTGLYFSDVQGGIYGGIVARETIDVMLQAGACGGGQSSWGPAVYGLVDEGRARPVEEEVRRFFQEKGGEGSVFVAHGRNSGAHVEVTRDAL